MPLRFSDLLPPLSIRSGQGRIQRVKSRHTNPLPLPDACRNNGNLAAVKRIDEFTLSIVLISFRRCGVFHVYHGD